MPVLKIQDSGAEQCHENTEMAHSMIPEDAYRAIRKYQPVMWGRFLSGLFLVSLLIAVGLFFYQRTDEVENPFVFFELRITDQQGHPVPGAKISWDQRGLGVSDSFGEWRRFMRVPLGERVRLDIIKSYGKRNIESHRLFQIPFIEPRKGELQMKAQVRVRGSGEKVSEDVFPWDVDAGETTSSSKVEAHSKWDKIWFTIRGPSFRKVLRPKLVSRAQELGLKIDKKAPWRVHVKVFKNGDNYLVRVESKNSEGGEKFRFLKRVQKTPLATARKILFGLKQHISFPYTVKRHGQQWKVQPAKYARSFFHVDTKDLLFGSNREVFTVEKHDLLNDSPCQGYESCQVQALTVLDEQEHQGLNKFNLLLYGTNQPIHVFVSGYYAQHEKGKVWSYRGKSSGKPFVTVLSRKKILYRGRIVNKIGKPSMISIQGPAVARK